MYRVLLLVSLVAINNYVRLNVHEATGAPVTISTQTDPAFDARVSHPAYPNRHPRVLFDEAHNNADTSNGRYRPFADLMAGDGYVILPNTRPLTRGSLAGYDILVMVNACGTTQHREISPFDGAEYDALKTWVAHGGALLLITDQPPFSSAVSELCQRFGIEITAGHTIDPSHHNDSGDETEIVFAGEGGLVTEHPIIKGRDTSEKINRIITFTGTSLKPPPTAVPFLKLADTALDVLPPDRKQTATDDAPADHKTQSAAGRAQGMAMALGKGRIVVLTEAAMLTAQVAYKGFRFGMNIPGTDNRQLALNIMHWLSRLLK